MSSDCLEGEGEINSIIKPFEEETKRVGNVEWCLRGCCKPMESEEESVCCGEENAIPVEFFQGT